MPDVPVSRIVTDFGVTVTDTQGGRHESGQREEAGFVDSSKQGSQTQTGAYEASRKEGPASSGPVPPSVAASRWDLPAQVPGLVTGTSRSFLGAGVRTTGCGLTWFQCDHLDGARG